jgi:hypothetical protein
VRRNNGYIVFYILLGAEASYNKNIVAGDYVQENEKNKTGNVYGYFQFQTVAQESTHNIVLSAGIYFLLYVVGQGGGICQNTWNNPAGNRRLYMDIWRFPVSINYIPAVASAVFGHAQSVK